MAEERSQKLLPVDRVNESILNESMHHSLMGPIELISPQLRKIIEDEGKHFTTERVVYTLFSFILLIIMQNILSEKSGLANWQQYLALLGYSGISVVLTKYTANRVCAAQRLKDREGYIYDKNDIVFKDTFAIIKLASFCFVASVLCACAGIAGGMVYAPLFLTYNMIP